MKRKSLLFLLLMALGLPWAANAQETVTIGNGTSGGSQTPFNSLYGYSFTEQIYPASAITIDDETVAGTITEIRFYLNQSYTDQEMVHDIVVYMKNVTRETFTSSTDYEPVTTSDIVFDGQWTIPMNYTGWLSITLDTPFEYDGESNLMVAMDENTSGYKTRYFRYTSVTNSGISFYSDSNNPDPYNLDSFSGSKSLRSNRADMQLVIELPSTDCPNPKTLVASDVTAHGATMTWTMDDETGDYQFNLEYKKTTEGENEWERIGLGNTRTYTLTGLDAETEYNVRIQTACDPENTHWKNLIPNLTTEVACPAPTNLGVTDGSITANEATVTWTGTSNSYVVMIGEENLILNANFEDNAIPAAFTNSTSYPWTVTAGGANGSSYCATPGNKGANSSTSDLTYQVTGPCTVSFMAKVSSESGWDKGSFRIDDTEKFNISGTQDWTSYSYELTEGTHTLVWRYYKDSSGASGSDLFYVDDIVVSAGVASWTEYTTTAQTYTFANLTPNTSYQVKVKGNCGSEGYSAEVGPVSFTTEVSCTAPTGLAIVEGYPTAHEVAFTWDNEEGATWQYYILCGSYDPTFVPTDANFANNNLSTNVKSFTELPAESNGTFWLRKKCGDSDYSDIVSLNFQTLVACTAPTGLAMVEGYPTAHGVSFTWNAEEGEMFQYAMLHGTVTDFSDVNWGQAEETNSASWSNLYADYNYTLALRKACGDVDGYSQVVSIPFRTLQEPVSVPFTDDFEDGQKWVFVNGNLTNAWAYGEATNNGGTHAMYISNDGGTSNAYNNSSAAMVYATKLFTFEDGIYVFSYDWKANGESSWDYLRVALVPASVTLTAATSVPSGFSTTTLPDGWIALDGGSKLNLKSDWQSFASDETEIAAGTYMMVFAWKDDTSSGSNPPAAVDNVSITKITCPTPTDLAYSNVKSNKVDLTWTSDAQAWQICINDATNALVDVSANEVTIEEGVVTYTLTDLTEETAYTVKVRANCGSEDGVSAWTEAVSFTTVAACSVEDVTISNIGHYTADVNWTGESAEGFTVKYREAASEDALFTEDFEDAASFANWTFTSMNTANNIASGKAGRLPEGAHNGSYGFRFSSYTSADDYNQYLVSPELSVTGELKFYAKQYGSGDDIYVGYSTTTNDLDAFTWDETALALTTSWQEFTHELPTNVKYIAFHYYGNYKYYAYVDDITIGAFEVPAGEWQTVTTDENTANLNGLTAGTKYDLTVAPNCDETLASEIQQFTTVSENLKYFITEGDWGTAANWEPAGAPTIDQTVELRANATITGEAEAKSIAGTGTGEGTYTLTIDGGKLKHLNSGVRATVKKHINGYGTGVNADGKPSGYYLITNPITSSFTPSADNGFLVGNYDLYSWDYMQDLEWRNYEASAFTTINSGAYGYLYANENGTTLTYTGTINAYTGNKYRSASVATNPENYDFPSWYLLGNPYLYDAYLAGASTNGVALPYIKMNVDGDGFENVAAGTPIEPMQGFFYQGVTGATSAYVVTYEPTVQDEGKLNMNLRRGNKQLDNAILVFGGNQQLGKMTFRANSSKIYMPVEGKDYAITTAESNMGEMPVSFKAETNGSYTLSFNAEEVTFAYLHLIDNLTGIETDLLANPSYSFEASTTDYASRFKLVFATGNNSNDDNFAFFSNGSFVINNEGNATLQVIDVTGRIISSESVNGCTNVNVNAAPGVYMLRLVNGENVRVQKVVVK